MTAAFSIQTYESPRQLEFVLERLDAVHPDWRSHFETVYIIDCSENVESVHSYREICRKHGFHYTGHGVNHGISGGRKEAARVFLQSQADYLVTQGDGMIWQGSDASADRYGFRRHQTKLFRIALELCREKGFDYLKLTFCEKYGTNAHFYAYHALRDDEKRQFFPECFKGTPRTQLDWLATKEGVPYLQGCFPYSNWPAVWSRRFARELILNDPNPKPSEQSWMRQWFRMQLRHGRHEWRGGCLLLSPVEYWHRYDYDRSTRREAAP